MNKVMQASTVAVAGLATSIATAAANALVDRLIGFNFFAFSFWFVVPVGSLVCGFAAASGYYFGAKFFHIRPSKLLLVQMVVIAAITQLLIYWFEYQTLYIDGVHVADFVPFESYMDIALTKQHLKVGRIGQFDAGEVGQGGYWLAVLDFLGFVVGGGFVYFLLLQTPSCRPCEKYLRTLVKKKDSFGDVEEFTAYYEAEFSHPIDSPEFAEHVGKEHSAGKAQSGTINMTTCVLECPSCGDQAVTETVQIFNGREWKDWGEWKRFVPLPKGSDVRRAYSGLL